MILDKEEWLKDQIGKYENLIKKNEEGIDKAKQTIAALELRAAELKAVDVHFKNSTLRNNYRVEFQEEEDYNLCDTHLNKAYINAKEYDNERYEAAIVTLVKELS